MFDRLEALAQGWERFSYVVDLTEAKRPGPDTRAALKARVLRVRPRVAHVAIVVGNNLLMRAMARLFAHGMGLVSVSIHTTRAEAIAEVAGGMGRYQSDRSHSAAPGGDRRGPMHDPDDSIVAETTDMSQVLPPALCCTKT
jgi:hypothetical protein